MPRVVPVSVANNPRALWFDPGELDIPDGTAVVVKTSRGVEYGRSVGDAFDAEDEQVKKLKSPLKPVLRIATDEDAAKAAEMEERSREALPVFKELAAEENEDMRPVAVEFLLDGDKAVFYFEAEERVDFRELVRKLAARFHVRIDMRQIGVRDEARLVGGLGHCGQELCCKRMGGEFCPVSIRMAKEQDLSLNPQKISGICGRLMCCLRYEYEAYKDFKKRAPKAGSKVSTPDGESKVMEVDVLREAVKLSREDDKPVLVPIEAFEEPAEGKRPSAVTEEGWEEAIAEHDLSRGGDAFAFITSQFTGTDKLAEAGAVRRTPGARKRQEAPKGSSEGSARKRRSRRGRKPSDGGAQAKQQQPARKQRRGRSTTISAEGERSSTTSAPKQGGSQRSKGGSGRSGSGPRPGQRSSGLRAGQGGKPSGGQQGGNGQRSKGASQQPQGSGSGHRRRRRRPRRSGAGQGSQGSAPSAPSSGGDSQ